MERNRIHELLDKYFNGKTTEDEEALLKESLSDPSLPSSLKAEYDYITKLSSKISEPSEDFYERLDALTRNQSEIKPVRKIIRYTVSIAASFLIVVGAWYYFSYISSEKIKDTYNDPDIALAEVKNILLTVSENMKAGIEPMESMNTMILAPESLNNLDKINDVVGSNLSRLRYLDQLNGSVQTTEKNKE